MASTFYRVEIVDKDGKKIVQKAQAVNGVETVEKMEAWYKERLFTDAKSVKVTLLDQAEGVKDRPSQVSEFVGVNPVAK